jgi:iron(III) transport system ATP-binding protein
MSFLSLKHVCKKIAGSNFQLHDINFSVEKGKILALVGESGSGKTTLLRLISGLEIPDSGFIYLNGKTLFDKDQFVPPEKRNIGYVFQDYALFPHMSVKENIRFGIDRLTTTEQQQRIEKMLDLVNLSEYAERYPNELSGGEQQRVALARALAMQPDVLLLDEPFSNLDFIKREHLKTELKSILQKTHTTAVFVTHDTAEALFLADKIVVMKEGKILQQGSPEKIYHFPVNSYVAQFFGKANIFHTRISEGDYLLPFPVKKIDVSRYDRVGICIRPNGFIIHDDARMEGTIEQVYFLGPVQELRIRVFFQESIYDFIIHTETKSVYHPGQSIRFDVLPEAVHFLLGEVSESD